MVQNVSIRLINALLGLSLLYSVDVQADNVISQKQLQTHVQFLSSDALEGRLTGSIGEKLATQYVANIFQQIGLEPAGDNGTFFQEFNFTSQMNIKKKIKHGRNVLARLRTGSKSAQLIVVGAHVDHLGRGELSGSLARGNEKGMIHPGADDNASGVASILEVAAKLSALKKQGKLVGNKDILFAAWSGEEVGIIGSSHFVKHFMQSSKNQLLRPDIDAAINLDMVGHLRESLVMQGVGSSPDWSRLLEKIKKHVTFSIITQKDPYLPTDSTAFYLHGVPTINFFTGAHDNYHTPRDKPELLNYQGMKTISECLVDLILAIESQSHEMAYQLVSKSSDKPNREFRNYLGTIPDYASSDVKGVKLGGVAKGSPAEQAGIKQDDVIIELAGQKINDIYDYTRVLNGLHVGKPVKLIVLRNNANVNLTIVAKYRE